MELLTTQSVARLTGLGADAIRWHAKQGRLSSITVARGAGVQMLFFLSDVQRFIERRAALEEAREQAEVSMPTTSRRGRRSMEAWEALVQSHESKSRRGRKPAAV
jgi:hypothetical protein